MGNLAGVASERDLFANFERMRREIDELFGDVFGRRAIGPHRGSAFLPPADISYAEDPPRAIVTVALPGVRLEDIQLEINDRALHIVGHRRPAEDQGDVYQQIEIERGPFDRIIELSTDVIAAETRATLEDGMLRIELPFDTRASQRRPVQIEAPRFGGAGAGSSGAAAPTPRARAGRAGAGSLGERA